MKKAKKTKLKKVMPRIVPEREFFMSIQDPVLFRKNLLEASKSTLKVLKAVHDIKEFRIKKHDKLTLLQSQMREIRLLLQKSEEMLPAYSKQDATRHFPKVMVSPTKKAEVIPIPQKTMSDLDKLNNKMTMVDEKMKNLQDSSTKEKNVQNANDELMQTLSNLNKKLKTL